MTTYGETIHEEAEKVFAMYKRWAALTEPQFEGDPFYKDPHGMARNILVMRQWVAEQTLKRFDKLVARDNNDETI